MTGIKTCKVSNGALKSEKLPNRLKVMSWGVNKSIDGDFTVTDRTVKEMSASQAPLGFERVAIDFNHCSVPGTDTYKELMKNGQVPPIFGYGRVNPIPNDGVYLEEIAWTPLGIQHAKNFEDISPALKDDKGEVTLIHSIALTPNGKINGLQFFAASTMADAAALGDDDEKMPGKKDGGHSSPPHGYPENPDHYADPKNFKYPLDTEEHAKAAWSYINQEKNEEGYNPKELKFMKGRIMKACKQFGISCGESTTKTQGINMLKDETLTLLSVAQMLGLPETSDAKAVTEKFQTVLRVASATPAATNDELKTLAVKIDGLVKRLDAGDAAAQGAERERLITCLAADGKAPKNGEGKEYSREDLLKLDVNTLKILSANTPVTVPLRARTMTAQLGDTKRFVSKDEKGKVLSVDLAGIFDAENRANGQASPSVVPADN